MSKIDTSVDDHRWEKQYAPAVSLRRVILISAVYVVWIAVLAVMAAQRWFGSLQ